MSFNNKDNGYFQLAFDFLLFLHCLLFIKMFCQKIQLFVIASLLSTVVFAQQPFTIKGHLQRVEDGVVLGLYREEGNTMQRIDSATVHKGAFSFVNKTDGSLECFSILSTDDGFPSAALSVWAKPGLQISITGQGKLIGSWQVSSSLTEQRTENKLEAATSELFEKEQRIMVRESSLRTLLMSGTADKKVHEEYATLNSQSDSLELAMIPLYIKVMKLTPIDAAWIKKLGDISSIASYQDAKFPYLKETKALFAKLTEKQKSSDKGRMIRQNLYPVKKLKAGDSLPEVDLYDLTGNIHHFSEYQGKYLLLDFWSYGCGPCISALKILKELSLQHKDTFTFISLSTDNKKVWHDASKNHPIVWNNLSDTKVYEGLYAKFGIKGLPFFVIVSPEGRILDSWTGLNEDDLKQKITARDGH